MIKSVVWLALIVALSHSVSGVIAADRAMLERQVLEEVFDAHRDHYLEPTCETIRQGKNISGNPDGAESQFRRALELTVLSREGFYLGLVDLARMGADFDYLAAQCWKELPKAGDIDMALSVAMEMPWK